jgi:hypothetical protein
VKPPGFKKLKEATDHASRAEWGELYTGSAFLASKPRFVPRSLFFPK